jgi:hypothetical protein
MRPEEAGEWLTQENLRLWEARIMLFPDGFWTMFTLIVVIGMAATTAAAALISAYAARRGTAPSSNVTRLPRPQRPASYPKAG